SRVPGKRATVRLRLPPRQENAHCTRTSRLRRRPRAARRLAGREGRMPAADTIDGILWSATERSPDRPAVLSGAHVWSYADLARVTSRVMTVLTAAGVRRGDHVALFIENSPEFIAAHYAVASLGAVIVSMNTHLRDQG